jgi:hypothetical protein
MIKSVYRVGLLYPHCLVSIRPHPYFPPAMKLGGVGGGVRGFYFYSYKFRALSLNSVMHSLRQLCTILHIE